MPAEIIPRWVPSPGPPATRALVFNGQPVGLYYIELSWASKHSWIASCTMIPSGNDARGLEMPDAIDTPVQLNEHIVEIRYKPNPKILDYRGTWAEMVSEHMGLDKWRIVENRFDVHDEDQTRRAFVSFRNAGFIVRNSGLRDYFPNQANKFLRFVLNQEPFGDPLFVIRLGVRSRFAWPFSGSFDELLQLYAGKLLTLTREAEQAFDAKLIDLGGPINFKTPRGNINSESGPMAADQLREYFRFEDNPPEAALYVDLDYWNRPARKVAGKQLLATVSQYAEENWDRDARIRALVLGEGGGK